MRFDGSGAWNRIARGGAKELAWRVYFRNVTNLSASVSSGSWTEVTRRIIDFDDPQSNLEYQLGDFQTDSIGMQAKGIAYWSASVFTKSSSADFVEVRVDVTLTMGSGSAGTQYVYTGLIDPQSVTYDELGDSVSFTVMSSMDAGSFIAGQYATTQFFDLTAAGASILSLPAITNLMVSSSNIAGYELKAGEHELEYRYIGYPDGVPVTQSVALDGGTPVYIGSGLSTLTNQDGTQKLAIFTDNVNALPRPKTQPSGSLTVKQRLWVVESSSQFPRVEYANATAKQLLNQLLPACGIASHSLEFTGSVALSGSRQEWTVVDFPVATTGSLTAKKFALEVDGGGLYVSVGRFIYYRNKDTEAYTLIGSCSALTSDQITRMVLDANKQHLWVSFGNSSPYYTQAIGQLALGTGVFTHTVASGSGWGTGHTPMSWWMVSGAADPSYDYGIYYPSGLGLAWIDGDTLSKTEVYTQAALGGGTGGGQGAANVAWNWASSGDAMCFQGTSGSTSVIWNRKWIAATWELDFNTAMNFQVGAQVKGESRVYFYDSTNTRVQYHSNLTPADTTSGSAMVLQAGTAAQAGAGTGSFAYMTFWNTNASFTGSTARLSNGSGVFLSSSFHDLEMTGSSTYVWTGLAIPPTGSGVPHVYGIFSDGRLYQYDSRVVMGVRELPATDTTVLETVRRILNAFQLVIVVTPSKTAKVFRRFNDAGTPLTSGQTLTLDDTDASQLSLVQSHIRAAQAAGPVRSDGAAGVFDGSQYNTQYLGTTNVVEIESAQYHAEFLEAFGIPCYHFFSTPRGLWEVEMGAVPLFQYEVLDNANVTFTGTKLVKSIAGDGYPIYGATYGKDGTMRVRVLI